MTNRKEQLFYKEALKKQLPIGSGEIESARRHVIQHRFKLMCQHFSGHKIMAFC